MLLFKQRNKARHMRAFLVCRQKYIEVIVTYTVLDTLWCVHGKRVTHTFNTYSLNGYFSGVWAGLNVHQGAVLREMIHSHEAYFVQKRQFKGKGLALLKRALVCTNFQLPP